MIEVHAAAVALLERGERGALCTVVQATGSTPQRLGAKLLLRADGSFVGTVGGGAIEAAVLERAQRVLLSGQAERFAAHLTRELAMCCGGRMDVFIEPLGGRPWLLLFGAGHVAAALGPVAATAGFRVHVIDEREELASASRHPAAERVTAEAPLDVLDRLPWGPETYAVIVTHDHRLDEDLLARAALLPFAYLGMIGSKAKVRRILGRLAAQGVDPSQLARVRSPIGLALGGREPGEIAVSVVAELIAVRRHSEGTMPLNIVPSVLES